MVQTVSPLVLLVLYMCVINGKQLREWMCYTMLV